MQTLLYERGKIIMTTREEIDEAKKMIETAEKIENQIKDLKEMRKKYKDCSLIVNSDGTVWLSRKHDINSLVRDGMGLYANAGTELRNSINFDMQDKIDFAIKQLEDFVL